MIVMHIDVNSAFLAWTAAYEKQLGIEKDIREVPAVIGGNEQNRHGIVLAKSLPAKKYKIQTGMSLMEARQLCPNLLVVPPNYQVYVRASKALREYLNTFTPFVEVFSIDECFLKFTDLNKEEAVELACKIKNSVKKIFGYTINIGVSTNKLLAKMAGDFEKPDKCHTCYPEEIKEKLWLLPVEELFMVGRRTKPKLNRLGIYTIGDLANADYKLLSTMLKSHGRMIYAYANGIDASTFKPSPPIKSVGNSSTLSRGCEYFLKESEIVTIFSMDDFVISLENSDERIDVNAFSLLILETDDEEKISIISADSPLILSEFFINQ